ncbi:hypothetical protein KC678_05750, partial [Candidatus Dojkabacteria bacterium]|nr:hypothetical protein [Candidatus Dojkabacteria bacterium]
MLFKRTYVNNVEQERAIIRPLADDEDIWFMVDWSPSMTFQQQDEIVAACQAWEIQYISDNPDWNGQVF